MNSILVVDDEKLIRDGITKEISKHSDVFKIIGEAEDGDQALEIVTNTLPDIVITDINMPRVNGMELIENIKAIYPDIRIIIISGYDDFQYAQKALQLGVHNYLLKPVEPGRLLETLDKVCSELDQQRRDLYDLHKLKMQVNLSLPAARERFLTGLVTGKIQGSEALINQQYLNLDITGSLFSIVILKFRKNPSSDTDLLKEDVLQKIVGAILQDAFPENVRLHPFFTAYNLMTLIFCFDNANQEYNIKLINQGMNITVIQMKKIFNLDSYAAIGKLCKTLEDLQFSYLQAEYALQYGFHKTSPTIINYEDFCIHRDQTFKRANKCETDILTNVALCEKEKALTIAEELFAHSQEADGFNHLHYKRMIFEIILQLMRSSEENGVLYEPGYNPYESVFQSDSLEELQKLLSDFVIDCINRIERVKNGRNENIIEKAKDIIVANIANSSFRMEDAAAKLYISPNYLRRLFKQETNKTFVEYITQIRMEKALALLDTSSFKVHEIAEKVGYEDSGYFSICFRKYYSLTPSDYREAKQLDNQ